VLNDLYGRDPNVYVPGRIILTLCAIALLAWAATVVRVRRRTVAGII
jgi:hypothetical protein